MIIMMTASLAGLFLLLIKFGVFKQWAGWMTASVVGFFLIFLRLSSRFLCF